MVNPFEHANYVINTVSLKTNRVILFYSGGKDSIVLLDLLAKKFEQVECVLMYFVKDLEHITKYIKWSQDKYFNIKFTQVPHYGLSQIYKNGIYCTPNKNIKRKTTLSDIDEAIRIKLNCGYTFYGWKKDDGLNRRLTLNGYELEAISKTGKVYPLSNWSKADVLRYIKRNRLPQPINYGDKRSNGVGFNLDCYLYLRDHYPNDLRKILKEFPLSERILYEYDNKISNGAQSN